MLPLPTSLSTPIDPPSSSANFFVIDSPNPVPFCTLLLLAAPPRAPRPANTEAQRPANNERRVITDQAGRTTTLEIRDDYGALVYTDHGMMNAGLKQERYTIAWDDPLSATADTHWTHELGRGDWRVRTETVTRLSCDADEFHMEARVTAFEGDTQVFEKTWRKSLPRG